MNDLTTKKADDEILINLTFQWTGDQSVTFDLWLTL